jgi:hypothetical protein
MSNCTQQFFDVLAVHLAGTFCYLASQGKPDWKVSMQCRFDMLGMFSESHRWSSQRVALCVTIVNIGKAGWLRKREIVLAKHGENSSEESTSKDLESMNSWQDQRYDGRVSQLFINPIVDPKMR